MPLGRKGNVMQNVKVLLVDDNKRIVNLLKEALTKEPDMEVAGTAADGEEALKLIELYKFVNSHENFCFQISPE